MDAKKTKTLADQLAEERRLVSFDNYDLTVRQLTDMRAAGTVFVPPEYQRQFVWGAERESALIESVFLGIPMPPLFMATNEDSTWEVVDGVQRLGTLCHFLGTDKLLEVTKKNEPLVIRELEKVSALNDSAFKDLPATIQLMFETRPIRVTVLNDKSDLNVRFDLFERLNTGGVSLTNQEIRNCIYRGALNDEIKKLAATPSFLKCIKLKPADENNGTAEELVLRFLAFLEDYLEFDHSVKDFLNDYMKAKRHTKPSAMAKKLFRQTFDFLAQALPSGIIRGQRNVTPVNLFEAVAVGTALALRDKKSLEATVVAGALNDATLRRYTTGGTNNRRMVKGRIEFVRDMYK